MSVSRKEETGFISWQSSNSSPGIPIKKRKFILDRPLSPPPLEPSCLSVKDDLVESKSSSLGYEDSFSNASVGTSSLGDSDAIRNSVLKIKNVIPADTTVNLIGNVDLSRGKHQAPIRNSVLEIKNEIPADTTVNLIGNVDLCRGKHQAPIPTIHSDSLDTVDSKEKLIISVQQKMTGITKLYSAPNEALAAHASKEVPYKLHVGTECTSEPRTVELSLGPIEPLVPALVAGQRSDSFSQMPDKLDPSSFCLFLSPDKCIGGCRNGDVKVNSAGIHDRTNRSNWDLNTTMDAWEGPVGVSGLKKFGGINGIEPLISSTAVLGTISDVGLQINDRISNFSMLSLPPTGQCRSEDSLHLSLSTFVEPNFSGEHSTSSVKVDSGTVLPNSNLVEGLVSAGSTNSVGCATIKSEPVDENTKHECLGARCNPMGLLDIERCSIKAIDSSNVSPEKLIEPRSLKCEPVQKGNQETQVISHKSIGEVVQCQDNVSSVLELALTSNKSCPSGLLSCSVLSMSGDAPNQFEHYTNGDEVNIDTNTTQGTCTMVIHVTSRGHESKESNASEGMIHAGDSEDAMDYVPLDSLRNNEGSESGGEKLNISADILEEDSFGSDYDADCNHDVDVCMNLEGRHDGRENGEYEDGEVQEALLHTVAGPMVDREEEKIIQGDCVGRISKTLDFPGEGITARAPNENDGKDRGEISDDHIKEETDRAIARDSSLQESSSTVEKAAAGADKKMPIKATQKGPLDLSSRDDVQKGHDTEELSDGATNGGQCIETTVSQITNANIKGTNTMKKVDPTLPKTESSVTAKHDANDGYSGGSRTRIINLPRASNVTSPCKSRFISDRTLVSTERERYADFEGEKVHLRRNRGEWYADGSGKFDRDRFQDQPFRSSRMNFVCGRGRGFKQWGEWDSDRNFGTEIYNGCGDYRFPRYKRASDGADTELEGSGYGMAPSRALGMGRGGRRPMSDELPSFRHPSSRRLSPGVRDGTGPRGIQMSRRFSGNVSSSRCNGEDVSNLVGPRHGGKFMRGLPEDVIDPIFSRPQPTYQGIDGQFGRGNRNFSTVHRRGLPRIRSKSPVRSRTRSPGPWSPPRRRSPDGFSGLPELTHRRSPTTYRTERTKSPDRPCFTEERVARRRGSPPYMVSNDLRDMDFGRLGQPRSANFNRSPSGQILPRSTRRFDTLDPRERTANDDYFGGPIRSGRFHQVGADGRGDERRKCGDRRVRSFRSPFNGADGENLHFHPEDGSRWFCQEGDTEFIERGNFRNREFDRQIKNRPGIALTRMRSLAEEEGNCSHGGKIWHDDGFDDVSQMKRRRF